MLVGMQFSNLEDLIERGTFPCIYNHNCTIWHGNVPLPIGCVIFIESINLQVNLPAFVG